MQQLDIFADSESVQRANDLIGALESLDRVAARQAMRDLVAADAHHEGLPRFQVLCDFVDRCGQHGFPQTMEAIVAEEQLIREHIVPASVVMGPAGNSLIKKCWDALANKSESASVSFENQNCFAAELYLRAQQFNDVVRTAREIPGVDLCAAAQRWLALGYKAEQARDPVLRFAWLSPERFDGLVDEMRDVELARNWDKFQTDLDDLDATWFPAWYALEKKPGIAILDNLPDSDGSRVYQLVMSLVSRECSGVHCKDDRARLKNLNESFFAFYLAHQAKLHPRKN